MSSPQMTLSQALEKKLESYYNRVPPKSKSDLKTWLETTQNLLIRDKDKFSTFNLGAENLWKKAEPIARSVFEKQRQAELDLEAERESASEVDPNAQEEKLDVQDIREGMEKWYVGVAQMRKRAEQGPLKPLDKKSWMNHSLHFTNFYCYTHRSLLRDDVLKEVQAIATELFQAENREITKPHSDVPAVKGIQVKDKEEALPLGADNLEAERESASEMDPPTNFETVRLRKDYQEAKLDVDSNSIRKAMESWYDVQTQARAKKGQGPFNTGSWMQQSWPFAETYCMIHRSLKTDDVYKVAESIAADVFRTKNPEIAKPRSDGPAAKGIQVKNKEEALRLRALQELHATVHRIEPEEKSPLLPEEDLRQIQQDLEKLYENSSEKTKGDLNRWLGKAQLQAYRYTQPKMSRSVEYNFFWGAVVEPMAKKYFEERSAQVKPSAGNKHKF